MSIVAAIGANNLVIISNIASFSKAYQDAAGTLYAMKFWQLLLYSGLLMPVLEELIFRALLFRVLRKWLPFWASMLTTSLAFGLYHGNLVQFVYASVLGCLLAFLYEKYGSIFAAILAHMCMNVTACIMTEYGWIQWMTQNIVFFIGITTICSVITVVAILYVQKLDVTKMLKNDCKQ